MQKNLHRQNEQSVFNDLIKQHLTKLGQQTKVCQLSYSFCANIEVILHDN